jgi:uncharacterized protein involved in outer membrane biogenesis
VEKTGMKRVAKTLAWIVGTGVILVLVALLVLTTVDWNRAKPWVEARASAAMQRPFQIRGDLHVNWQREGFWPHPFVTANDVHVGAPPNTGDKEFASVDGADLQIELLPLLAHRVKIPALQLHAPALRLERRADGSNNWTFASANPLASAWKVHLGQLNLDHGRVDYVDAQRKADLHVDIKPLQKNLTLEDAEQEQEADSKRAAAARVGEKATQNISARARQRGASPTRRTPQNYLFSFTVTGTYAGAAVNAQGRVGDLFAAVNAKHPFPIQVRGTVGASHLAVVGTITDPGSPDALDLRLWLSGPSMDQLYPILGIVLPSTPPYATDGRLTGRFDEDGGATLTYRHFSAQLGASDLGGEVTYRGGKGRPLLSGKVTSEQLRFLDLAPLIGLSANAKTPEKMPTDTDRRLPGAAFRTDRWQTMDADVEFDARHIERDRGELPIGDVSTHIMLVNARLLLDPLRFGVAGGKVEGAITVDGATSPPPGDIALRMRDVQLKQLLAGFTSLEQASLGEVNGDLHLAGHGNSIAAVLGTSDGEVRLLINEGEINKSILEIAGLNVLNYILTKLFGDEPVRIHCAAADLIAKDGVLTPRIFSIDTDAAEITVDGNIDLGSEKLDLTVHPQAKKLRLLSLRSPLHVRGTLSKPDVGVNKGPLILRSVAAAALATLAPEAALGALIAPSHEREMACRPMLESLRKGAAGSAAKTPAPKH